MPACSASLIFFLSCTFSIVTGKDSGFWVYLIGPIVGATSGGAFYDFWYARAYSGKRF
jgi:glycerol uptake facilitator-like aquaporin